MLPDCYLIPISNCTIPETDLVSTYLGQGPLPETPVLLYFRQDHSYYHPHFIPPVRIINLFYVEIRICSSEIHQIMSELLPGAQLDVSWWRSVTTKFIWRPNPRFSQFLDQVDFRLFGAVGNYPQRAFGIHVRHGDKASEMTLHGFEDYMMAAEEAKKTVPYVSRRLCTHSSKTGFADPCLFISFSAFQLLLDTSRNRMW